MISLLGLVAIISAFAPAAFAANLKAGVVDTVISSPNDAARLQAIDRLFSTYYRNPATLSQEQYSQLLLARTQSCRSFGAECLNLSILRDSFCASKGDHHGRFLDTLFPAVTSEERAKSLLTSILGCHKALVWPKFAVIKKLWELSDKNQWSALQRELARTFAVQIKLADIKAMEVYLPIITASLQDGASKVPIQLDLWRTVAQSTTEQILALGFHKKSPALASDFQNAAADILPRAGYAMLYLDLQQGLMPSAVNDQASKYSGLVLKSCWSWQVTGQAARCLSAIQLISVIVGEDPMLWRQNPALQTLFDSEAMMSQLFLGKEDEALKLMKSLSEKSDTKDPLISRLLPLKFTQLTLSTGDLVAAENYLNRVTEAFAQNSSPSLMTEYLPKIMKAWLLRQKGQYDEALALLDTLKPIVARFVSGTVNETVVTIETERMFNALIKRDYPLALAAADSLSDILRQAPFDASLVATVEAVRSKLHLQPVKPAVDKMRAFYGVENFKVRELVRVLSAPPPQRRP